VALTEHKNGVLIRAKRAANPDDTLTPAEAKTVRRGEAQLKRGEPKPWRDPARLPKTHRALAACG
jgi:hypothetical protein